MPIILKRLREDPDTPANAPVKKMTTRQMRPTPDSPSPSTLPPLSEFPPLGYRPNLTDHKGPAKPTRALTPPRSTVIPNTQFLPPNTQYYTPSRPAGEVFQEDELEEDVFGPKEPPTNTHVESKSTDADQQTSMTSEMETTEEQAADTDETSNGHTDALSSVREALMAQMDEAKKDTELDEFPTYIDFEAVSITPIPDYSSETNVKPTKLECRLVPLADIKEELGHLSTNPIDFMTDQTYEQCKLAKNGQEHKLGLASMVLVQPGYRILAKVAHMRCPKERLTSWIKFNIRSALHQNDVPLNEAIACLDMHKNTYDWFVVSLTKRAYKAISPYRAIHDPRSNVLVLIRPYDLKPHATQHLSFSGVIMPTDLKERHDEILSTFKNQIDTELLKQGAVMSKTEISTHTNGMIDINAEFTFSEKAQPRIIKPDKMPSIFIFEGQERKINAKWPRRCVICASEKHTSSKEKHCPWTKYDFDGKKVNLWSPQNLQPGQSERPPKRPREDEPLFESYLTDVRPANHAKRQKTGNLE